jgi:hypothetical protein
MAKKKRPGGKIEVLLWNLGAGKTEYLINYCKKHPGEKILYVTTDCENVLEVQTRSEMKNLTPYIYCGKESKIDPGCDKDGDKYGPHGCPDCTVHVCKADCPHIMQFQVVGDHDEKFVVTTHYCLFLTGVAKFDTVLIDESVQGILFSSWDLTREEFAELGIEFDSFPEPTVRKCGRDCPTYEICYRRNDGKRCGSGNMKKLQQKNAQSRIVELEPKFMREPDNQEEYFLYQKLSPATGTKSRILGCWDFYHDMPLVIAVGSLPVLPVKKIIFASATASPSMVTDWFFSQYHGNEESGPWTFEFSNKKQPYGNQFTMLKRRGNQKNSLQALKKGEISDMLNEMGVKPEDYGNLFIAVWKKYEKMFQNSYPEAVVRHYPCYGIDKLKHLKYVLLTAPFRYPRSIKYLLSEALSWGIVEELEESVVIQIIGRVVRGPDAHEKVIFAMFEFESEDFNRKQYLKEARTKYWIYGRLRAELTLTMWDLYKRAKEDQYAALKLDRNLGHFRRLYREVCDEMVKSRVGKVDPGS